MASSPVSSSSSVAAISTGVLADNQLIEKVLPEVPQKALQTVQGTLRVNVRVSVDRSGGVVEATLDAVGPSRYFADLALQAARNCKFRPAADGPEARNWILQFEFRSNGTTVAPVPSRVLKATSRTPSAG
jgi:TonB family protein